MLLGKSFFLWGQAAVFHGNITGKFMLSLSKYTIHRSVRLGTFITLRKSSQTAYEFENYRQCFHEHKRKSKKPNYKS